ncbi:uncharacterized protein EV420DRAFT_86188 [Desarmillaria tabescens]|uniref:Uncharacterized protein n=1 Tax=Armillaria tabescens TaxID=1929756 RepID=A0AA39NQL0_ARMTA|nr:uncharacterized protein EV420DRAFT_86188 [Desarmillaria tabescens]KAK0470047.1 hypothetical protein EV420DRAFT_86188 [Desarmillaria tabescens]
MTPDEPICLFEDEHRLRKLKNAFCSSTYWPHLTHYESLAVRFDSHGSYPGSRSPFTKIKNDGTTSIINDSIFRRLRLEAFFLALEGFYTGNSDLAGRHLDRFSYIWSRWLLLYSDMCQLMSLTVQSIKSSVDCLGKTCEDVVYSFTDQALWERCQSKWLVPKEGYAFVLGWTEKISERLSECDSQPKLQERTLLDLPNEILHSIFCRTHPIGAARRLSAACHRLHGISLPYIYLTRSLGLSYSYSDLCPEDSPDETKRPQKMKTFIRSIIQCLSQSHFLLTCPDITQRIEYVHITNGWLADMNYDFPDTFVPASFMPAIVQAICTALRASICLSTIRISSYDLNETFISTFLALPRLHTLQLSRCSLSHNVFDETEPLHNVRNLSLGISKGGSSLWNILALCPNVHNLILFDRTESILAVPSDVIHFGNFCNLRRFSLGSVEDGSDGPAVGLVVDWLNRATEHHLTHFKLTVRQPAADAAFLLLLDALQPHPLEEFIFNGLLEGHPVVFDRISQSFPRLRSLRLFRRSSNRQREASHCEWPSPPWEYAQRLASFGNLQYFGRNYLIIRDGYSPCSMQVLEGALDVFRKDDCFGSDGDTYLAASVFAAHCTSLRTMVMLGRDASASAICTWDIERIGGKVVISGVRANEAFQRKVWNPWDWDEPDEWW